MSEDSQGSFGATLMIAVEIILFIFYLPLAGFFWVGFATGVGGNAITISQFRVSSVAIWLPLHISFILCIWLHIKKRRVIALLVSFLPPVLTWLMLVLVDLLAPLTGWRLFLS